MKKIQNAAFLLIFFVLLCSSLTGQRSFTVNQVPDPKRSGTGYVSDPANYLKEEEVASINAIIAAMEDSTTAQVAVVVLPSIGEENPKEFATELFNTWKIGQAGTDNGLLILVVMDQRRTEFETGYGLEGVLPDILCYRIGMEALVPYFQQEKYGEGLLATISRFKNILENPESVEEIYANPEKQEKRGKSGPLFYIYLLLNIVFHLFILGYAFFILRSQQELVDKFHALRKVRNFFPLILFPLPFILVYLWLGRKLRHLRYQPRFSKVTGAAMHLVPESEEDTYLEKGHVTEEEIGSADYDVWVTDAGDDILILRYSRRFSHYSKCPSCKYSTYSLAKTDTIQAATYTSSGLRRETYQCKNCHFQKTKDIILPKLVVSSSHGGKRGGGSWGGSSSWGGGSSGGGGGGVSW